MPISRVLSPKHMYNSLYALPELLWQFPCPPQSCSSGEWKPAVAWAQDKIRRAAELHSSLPHFRLGTALTFQLQVPGGKEMAE